MQVFVCVDVVSNFTNVLNESLKVITDKGYIIVDIKYSTVLVSNTVMHSALVMYRMEDCNG